MENEKNLIIILILILILACVVVFLKNECELFYNKKTMTEIEFINKYTDMSFDKTTKVKEFVIEDNVGSNVFNRNQFIKGVLVVPNTDIARLFPVEYRMTDEYMITLVEPTMKADVDFDVVHFQTVVKRGIKTQRTIWFTIMKPKEEGTTVYYKVNKLGWELYN